MPEGLVSYVLAAKVFIKHQRQHLKNLVRESVRPVICEVIENDDNDEVGDNDVKQL